MPRTARRAPIALRLESLEPRTLLSADPARAVSAAWVASTPVDPAASILVRFISGATSAQIQADLDPIGGRVVTTYEDGPSVVALPPWEDRAAALADLQATQSVVYAEANATFHASGVQAAITPVTPNNPGYAQQWGMAAIDAPAAWAVTTGTPATIVAVLDTGIDLSNPAFLGRIWVNPDTSGRDGYKYAFYGWNFIAGNNNVSDDNGHGTHVTGILAAAGNTGVGIAGVNWNTRIMPLKVLDSKGDGSTDAAVSAVYYAVNHGAKVINASWGGDGYSQAMLDALNYANSKGVVFVTAAGNEASNNDVTTTYPASYRTPNELVVAAVDKSGKLANYSNWGAKTVDLAAPGTDIYSTVPGGFDTYSGTSMATPFVSGSVALLAGLNPGMSAAQLVARIKATVRPNAALNGLMASPGVVDPYYALVNYVTQGISVTTKPVNAPNLVAGASSFDDVEAGLLISDGVYALFGGTDSGYVAGVYRAVFGRAPSAGELSYQTAALQSGVNRFNLVRSLQSSVEGLRTRVARWYIDDLYSPQSLDALKSDSGVRAWADRLASGWTSTDVLAALMSNDMRYAGLGGTDVQFVSALYYGVLARDPDAGGLSYYLAALASGASRSDVVRRFLASPEGRVAAVARLYRNDLGSTYTVAQLAPDNGVKFWAGYLGTA